MSRFDDRLEKRLQDPAFRQGYEEMDRELAHMKIRNGTDLTNRAFELDDIYHVLAAIGLARERIIDNRPIDEVRVQLELAGMHARRLANRIEASFQDYVDSVEDPEETKTTDEENPDNA